MLQDWHYIVLLGAVIVVAAYALPRSKKANGKEAPVQSIQNMETALEQFMENLEKDNEELAELVLQAQRDAKAEAARKDKDLNDLKEQLRTAAERIAALEARPAVNTSSASVSPATERAVVQDAPLEAFNLPLSMQPEAEIMVETSHMDQGPAENTIRARYADLFQLYDQGKSIDVICKKLGLHKGEVQLILGLAKQEEGVNVK